LKHVWQGFKLRRSISESDAEGWTVYTYPQE
jgi:hypothetical protein